MRLSLTVNGTSRTIASLQGPGFLNAHVNMSDRTKESERSNKVRIQGSHTAETETTSVKWPAVDFSSARPDESIPFPDRETFARGGNCLVTRVSPKLISRRGLRLIDWITSSAPLDRVDLAKVIDQGSGERSRVDIQPSLHGQKGCLQLQQQEPRGLDRGSYRYSGQLYGVT